VVVVVAVAVAVESVILEASRRVEVLACEVNVEEEKGKADDRGTRAQQWHACMLSQPKEARAGQLCEQGAAYTRTRRLSVGVGEEHVPSAQPMAIVLPLGCHSKTLAS